MEAVTFGERNHKDSWGKNSGRGESANAPALR